MSNGIRIMVQMTKNNSMTMADGETLITDYFYTYPPEAQEVLHHLLEHDRALLKRTEEVIFRKVNVPHDNIHSLALRVVPMTESRKFFTVCLSGWLSIAPKYLDLRAWTCELVERICPETLVTTMTHADSMQYNWDYTAAQGWSRIRENSVYDD